MTKTNVGLSLAGWPNRMINLFFICSPDLFSSISGSSSSGSSASVRFKSFNHNSNFTLILFDSVENKSIPFLSDNSTLIKSTSFVSANSATSESFQATHRSNKALLYWNWWVLHLRLYTSHSLWKLLPLSSTWIRLCNINLFQDLEKLAWAPMFVFSAVCKRPFELCSCLRFTAFFVAIPASFPHAGNGRARPYSKIQWCNHGCSVFGTGCLKIHSLNKN